MFNRKCTDIRPNHFKSALGGATYVYASWDSLPLVLTVPNHGQKHRLDCDRRAESINRLQSGRLSQVQA